MNAIAQPRVITMQDIAAWCIAFLFNLTIWSDFFQMKLRVPKDIKIYTIISIVTALTFILLGRKLYFEDKRSKQLVMLFNFSYLFVVALNLSSSRSLSQLAILVILNFLLFNERNSFLVFVKMVSLSEYFIILVLVMFFKENWSLLLYSPEKSNFLFEPFSFQGTLASYLFYSLTLYFLKKRSLVIKIPIALLAYYAIFQTGIRHIMVVSLFMCLVYIMIYFGIFKLRYLIVIAVLALMFWQYRKLEPLEYAEGLNEQYVGKSRLEQTDRPIIAKNYIKYMFRNPKILFLGADTVTMFPSTGEYYVSENLVGGYGPHNGFIGYFYQFGIINGILFFMLLIQKFIKCKSKYFLAFFMLFCLMSFATESFYTYKGIPSLSFYVMLGACETTSISLAFKNNYDLIIRKKKMNGIQAAS